MGSSRINLGVMNVLTLALVASMGIIVLGSAGMAENHTNVQNTATGLLDSTNPVPAPPPPPAPAPPPPPPPAPPPPPPPVASLDLYIAMNGQQSGPFNFQVLRGMVASGQFRPDTIVWKQGMVDWAPAGSLQELSSLFANGPGPVNPNPQPNSGFDPQAYVVGRWVSDPAYVDIGDGQQGLAKITFTYNADGTVTSQGTVDLQGPNGPMQVTTSGRGTYTVRGQGNNSIVLTPNVQMTISVPGQGSFQRNLRRSDGFGNCRPEHN